jgi:RHS repeat-associated protein
MKDWVSGEEINHQYDELGRLIASATTGPQWGLSWTYDGFGNRLAQNVTKGTAPVVSLSISAATNRITTSGFAYDAAGNLVQWPGGTVTIGAEYDVDGRLSVVKWDGVERERYYYDARNLRVAGGGSYQVYGLSGELLGEYRPVPNSTVPEMWLERVYFAGRLVATLNNYGWEASNTDRLGSVRAARRYPFGEGNNADNDEFATYRKDTTTQHYYAWHRFYSATWGRFSSPDPYVMSGGLTNPQGWNRYSYVANDPVNYYDPRGLQQDVPTFTVTVYGVSPETLYGGGARKEGLDKDAPEVLEGLDFWQAGGNAGGNVTALKDRDLLGVALDTAIMALQQSKDCEELFGTAKTRAAGRDPVTVLKAIASGTAYATIEFADKGPKYGVAGVTVSVPRLARKATITINTYNDPWGVYWNDGLTEHNAHTLLHELGHVFDLVSGLGQSRIKTPDSAWWSRDAGAWNDWLIDQNCFGGRLGYKKP